MWKLVSFHLDIVLILTQDRCTVCADILEAGKSFWTHQMELLGDAGQVEPYFDLFGDSVSINAR
jgi:hypothetical protein